MLFNSYEFLFVYLPVTWVMFLVIRRFVPVWGNAWLALASLFFYGWWDIRFMPIFLTSVAFNFAVGRKIQSAVERGQDQSAHLWLWVGVSLNLVALGFFKYVDFFITNIDAITDLAISPIGVLLPIGISFFTFTQIAFLVDTRRGLGKHYSPINYTLFVSFFPHLIAGPIIHHREMMPQFSLSRGPDARAVALGLTIFVAGLFKKVIIADNVAVFSTPIFAAVDAGADVTTFEAWGAALAYTFQIYFDFSGYSDMAIGLALLFGIRLPINFHSPYRATSIIEFWRRWHMTLSRFLRDYLYIPLGGNRKGPGRRQVNLFLTMLLGGFWHGADWGFVIWGALHGFYLAVNHAVRATALGRWFAASGAGIVHRWTAHTLAWALTFLAVVIAWVFFRATTLHGAFTMLSAMAGQGSGAFPADAASKLGVFMQHYGLGYGAEGAVSFRDWRRDGVPLLLVAGLIAVLAPNTNQLFLARERFYAEGYRGLLSGPRFRWLAWQPHWAWAVSIVLCFTIIVFSRHSASEFLYFQF